MYSLWRQAHRPVSLIFRQPFSSAAGQETRKGWSNITKALVLGPPVFIGGWILTSDHPEAAFNLATQFPLRLARDVVTAASIVADYKSSLPGLEGDAYELAIRQCHLRSAEKLQQLCFANGGIYIKLGQVAAQMDHLLPEEYVMTLRQSMLDKCPVTPFSVVVRTIFEDLGAPPSELFAEFDEEPIASASLAQVHHAVSHDGKQLAVKVQHAGLLDTYAADVATVSVLVHLVHLIFPDFDYSWLVSEIKNTLPNELDFKTEATNAERCRVNLRSRLSKVKGRVHVPEIHHMLSSTRVLTMEYVQGVKVTEKGLLQRMGVKPQEVAQLVAETFSEMIFIHGDVHCDPHAANMLVRLDSRLRPQLVLLDHGLYRQVDDAFRIEYAALWQALVFADVEGIKRHTAKMNAGEMYPLFAAMLTSRPWDDITKKSADHLYIPTNPQERAQLQQHAQTFAKEISTLLLRMPPELLLLLKTNDCLRSVDLALGQPVNTFIITARECSRALALHRQKEHPGLRSWLTTQLESLRVNFQLLRLTTATWLVGVRRSMAESVPLLAL